MRILAQPPLGFGNAHLAQQLERARARRLFAQAFVHAQALGQLAAHGEHRVQRGHRLLKNHADFVATNCAHQRLRGVCQIDRPPLFAIKNQAPTGDITAAKFNQAHQRQRRHRFSRARFAHDAHSLARVYRERHVFHTHHGAILCLEFDAQILDSGDRLIQHPVHPVFDFMFISAKATDRQAPKSN